MVQENSAKNSSSNAPGSYLTIDMEMNKRAKKTKNIKAVFGTAIVALLIFVTLYFSLSCFRIKGMQISGLNNLTREDFLKLSGYNENDSLLFFKSEDSGQAAVKNSQGIVLDCKINTNPFVCKAQIVENYPVGTYKGQAYVASGQSYEDFYKSIDNLSLPETNKSLIKSKLSKEEEKALAGSVPTIHLPNDTMTMDATSSEQAFSVLKGQEESVLSSLSSIQFLNENNDDRWNNVMDVVIKDDSNYYVIENVLSNKFGNIFSNKKTPLSEIIYRIRLDLRDETNVRNVTTYTFKDDKTSISCFEYEVYFTKDNLIDIVYNDGKE